MDTVKYKMFVGLYIYIALTASITSASESDARNIGESVWNCTVQTFNHSLYAAFTTDNQCQDQNRFQTCLNGKLKTSTNGMAAYSESLATCKPLKPEDQQKAVDMVNCAKSYWKGINTWGYLKKIQDKMNSAPSSTLQASEQKLYYCEALLLTSEAVNNKVIAYCLTTDIFIYSKYFILPNLEYACQKALNRSHDNTNVNVGGHTHSGGTGDFDFDNFFSDPLFHITPFPTGSQTKTSTGSSNTGSGSNIVSGPGGGATSTTSASLSNHGDAHAIGLAVWRCSSQTYHNILYSIFLDDIQCRFQNQYNACLGNELSQSTGRMQQYNQELHSGCTYVSQASQFAETCVVERESAMGSWNCLAGIEAKMATATTANLTLDEQKTFYCEALIVASDCISNNGILPCGLEGLELYTNYFTFVPLVQSCYTALGRSPDVVDINDGGNTQTGTTTGVKVTTTITQPQTLAPTTADTTVYTTKSNPTTTTAKTTSQSTRKPSTTQKTTTGTTTKESTTVPTTPQQSTTIKLTTTTALKTTSHTTESNQGDAKSIGQVVWKCSSQTFHDILYSIFLDDIQCRFKNQYDTCLGTELSQNTQGIRQYNQELHNNCNLVSQASQSAENCVVGRENSMASWNCSANIDAKMATVSTIHLTFDEQKTYYCEAIILASECISNNAIVPCGFEGLVLYTEYFTFVPLVQACYAALGRSPDVTDINDGGSQQTASASKTTITKSSHSTSVKTTTKTTSPTTQSTTTKIPTTKIPASVRSTSTAPKTTIGSTTLRHLTETEGYTGQTNPPENVIGPINRSTRLAVGIQTSLLAVLIILAV